MLVSMSTTIMMHKYKQNAAWQKCTMHNAHELGYITKEIAVHLEHAEMRIGD